MLTLLVAILALESAFGLTTWTDVKFSVDLAIAAANELSFLRTIDEKGVLYDDEYISKAIQRYEQCWLPLQAQHPDSNILPPLDVHWVWHTHMLAPLSYRKDSIALVGRVIDHKSWSQDEIQQRRGDSILAWKSWCHSEPFDFLEAHKLNGTKKLAHKSSYDIAAAVQRQRDFNRKILALTSNEGNDYLEKALDRYKKFLFLLQTHPGSELSPTLDMDLIWHTHQTHPLTYANDCKEIFNFLLNHDDSVDKKGLYKSVKLSNTLWNEHFPTETFISSTKSNAELAGGCCASGANKSSGAYKSNLASSCSGSCSTGSCSAGSCSAGSCSGTSTGNQSKPDMCAMNMYFHMDYTKDCILFEGWRMRTVGALIASFIGIVLMSVVYEALKFGRQWLHEYAASHRNSKLSPFTRWHLIQTILVMIQVFLSYMLMMVFMAYNVYLCIALIVGTGIGYFIFGWRRKVDAEESCCN